MANKTCKKCKQSKPLTEYYKAKQYTWEKDGLDYYCKYCRNGSHLTSIRTNKKQCSLDNCTNPHYAKQMCRLHYARNVRNGHPDPVISIVNKKENREYHLRYKYLMTYEEFEKRAANGCEICGNKPERNLQVDHDHKCCNGQTTCGNCVRGIICNRCNQAVDKMEDQLIRADYPEYEAIKQYLEKYNG